MQQEINFYQSYPLEFVKFYEELPVKILFQFWKKMSSNILAHYKFVLDRKPALKQLLIQWTRCMEMRTLILLVDAKIVFNSLKRQSFLHNISNIHQKLWSTPLRLFIVAGTEFTSRKGNTQGDLIRIGIYCIRVTPLSNILIDNASNE